MDTPPLMERRMLLRGAGVAGASLVGVAAIPAAASAHGHDDHDSHDSSAIGAWFITHKDNPPGDTTPGTSVVTFAPGGVFTAQDLAPLGAAGLGAWEPDGSDRFKVLFWTGAKGETAKDPDVVIKIEVRGKVDHDKVSGTYSGTVYDAKTMKVLVTFTGTFSGARVEP